MRKARRWKYRNTTLLALSIVTLFFLADTDIAHALINHIGAYGYVGAVVTGIFFVSTFTVAPASLVLFHLAQEFNPVLIALFSGVGAVIGDLLIFRFLKDGVFDEMRPLLKKLGGTHSSALFRTPYFAWIIPVVGAFIIASPLPDEIGIGMLGLTKMKWWKFAFLAFFLNAFGIFIIISLASTL